MSDVTGPWISPSMRYAAMVYTIALMVFGTVGNVLLLLTLLYKRYKRNPPNAPIELKCIGGQNTQQSVAVNRVQETRHGAKKQSSMADKLLRLLTITDLLCLWVLVLRYLINLFTKHDVRAYSSIGCKIHTFLSMSLSNLSTAILCIFAAHRAICIRWPLACHTWLTRGRMNICLAVAFVFILSKHMAVLFLFDLNNASGRYECDVKKETAKFNTLYYNFEFATHVIVGYSLLILCNIGLCISLTQNRRLQTATQNVTGKPTGDGLQIARIILLFSVIQVITSVPFFILIELNGLYELHMIPRDMELTVYYILTLALFTNNAINFYLLIGVSERFRQDTKLFLLATANLFSKIKRGESESLPRKESAYTSDTCIDDM